MSPPNSGMSSLVRVMGLMPSATVTASPKESEFAELSAKRFGRPELDSMDAERRCGFRVSGVVVDEHRFPRGDQEAHEKDPEVARIAPHDARFAGNRDPGEP